MRSCWRIFTAAVGMVLASFCLCAASSSQTLLTPPWLTWLGNSTHNWSCLSGNCVLNDEAWFGNFTIAKGATLLNTAGNGPIIIRATGTCSIDGTINTSPNVPGQTGITGNGDFGGGGGGGGGGSSAGQAGRSTQVILGIPIVNGGAGGGAGTSGQAGNSTTPNQYQMFLSTGSDWPGGGGLGGKGGSNGGAAGQGGAPVIIVCNTIAFTGTIDVSGGTGGDATADNTGAGAGGGGGYVVFAARTYSTRTGTIIVNGGAGGSCNGHLNCGAGGHGGNGWNAVITIQ